MFGAFRRMKRKRSAHAPAPRPLAFGPSSVVFPSPEKILQTITAMTACPLSIPEIARIVVDFAKPGWLEITGSWEGVPSEAVRLRASPTRVFVSESSDDTPEPGARCFDITTGEFLPPVVREREQPALTDVHGGPCEFMRVKLAGRKTRINDPHSEPSAAAVVSEGFLPPDNSVFGFRHAKDDAFFCCNSSSGEVTRWSRGGVSGVVMYQRIGSPYAALRGLCRISETEIMIIVSEDNGALCSRCCVATSDLKTTFHDVEVDFDEADSPRWWWPSGALEAVPYRGGMLAVVNSDVYWFRIVGNACRVRRWPFPLSTRATDSTTTLRVLGDDLFVSDVSRVWRLSLNAMPPSTAPFHSPFEAPVLVTADKVVVPDDDL